MKPWPEWLQRNATLYAGNWVAWVAGYEIPLHVAPRISAMMNWLEDAGKFDERWHLDPTIQIVHVPHNYREYLEDIRKYWRIQ